MQPLSYPAILKREVDGQGFVVTFPDLPEALTGGGDLLDSLSEAADCLGEALAGRVVRGDPIPPPSNPRKRHHPIPMPLDLAPKVALYVAMRERGMTGRQLAQQLGCRETAIRQMLDPKRESKPDRLEAALRKLGKSLVLAVDDAA